MIGGGRQLLECSTARKDAGCIVLAAGPRVEQQEGNGAVIRIKYSVAYSSVFCSAHARELINGVQVHLGAATRKSNANKEKTLTAQRR
jgi:hypothetical protein